MSKKVSEEFYPFTQVIQSTRENGHLEQVHIFP